MSNENDETPKNQNAGNQGDNNNRETDSEQKGEMLKDIKSELGKLNKTLNSMVDKLRKMQQHLEKELSRYEKNLTKREHELNGKVRKLKNSEENLKKRQEKLNANKVRKCTCCCASRIIIAVLIVVCLVFSICVFNSMKNCEITVNETTTFALDYNKNPAMPIISEMEAQLATTTTDNTRLNYNGKPPCPPRYDKIVQKRVNWYPVFGMTYFVVLAGTVVALIVLLAKDDSWFRCAKLDELHVIKEKLLEGEVNDSANKTEIEDKSAQRTTNMGKDSNTNTKITETTKTNTTTEITDQRAELLKHYMNCVVEI